MFVKVFVTGYSHVDSEWLWSLEEALHVVDETFSSVIELMEKYDDLFFVGSSSLYYEYIEKNNSVLFNRIKDFVKNSRWGLAGGFVEFDANMPSGESIVRQLVISQKYFFKRFNKYARILFLPDSFGFPASLPQLLIKAGFKYFVTTKLRWNDANEFPYNIFIWRSADGSEVLSYVTPLDYNEFLTNYRRVALAVIEQLKKQSIPAVLIVYGRGDHGGGIDEETIKNIMDWRKLEKPFIVEPAKFEEFFEYIERNYIDKLPIYMDELYLEFHRGVYTTGSLLKKLNRYNEELLLGVEKLYTIIHILFGGEYPSIIERLWRLLLINQGHDALSATLSSDVYLEVKNRALMVFKSLVRLYREGFKQLLEKIDGRYIVFNPYSFPLTTYMRVCGSIRGKHQDLGNNEKLVFLKSIPPIGFKALSSFNDEPDDTANIYEDNKYYFLENKYLKVSIDKRNGWITSIIDKQSMREALKKPIRLRIHNDLPMPTRGKLYAAGLFDAWEIYYLDGLNKYLYKDLKAISVKAKHRGPWYASVVCRYKYRQRLGRGYAYILAEIGLYADKPYIEIYFDIIWRTKHKLLKLIVPLNIDSKTAVFEIPYGVVEREDPARSADPYDRAKHEVPGHSWVDVSNGDFGVSIITDSKYGYSWLNGVLGVSFLRSPLFPVREAYTGYIEEYKRMQDKMLDFTISKLKGLVKKILNLLLMLNTYVQYHRFSKKLLYMDQGRRTVKVWIYPHKGTYMDGKTYRIAKELVKTMIIGCKHGSAGEVKTFSMINIEPDDIMITAFKLDGHNKILLRAYNPMKVGIRVCLRTYFKYRRAFETDFLGNILRELKRENTGIKLYFGPYEVKTIIFEL